MYFWGLIGHSNHFKRGTRYKILPSGGIDPPTPEGWGVPPGGPSGVEWTEWPTLWARAGTPPPGGTGPRVAVWPEP